jgi:hypothetical protein
MFHAGVGVEEPRDILTADVTTHQLNTILRVSWGLAGFQDLHVTKINMPPSLRLMRLQEVSKNLSLE